MITDKEKWTAIVISIAICAATSIDADGYSEPIMEPEVTPLLRCDNNRALTFERERERDSVCNTEERKPNKPPEVECTMNQWAPTQYARNKDPEGKKCA